jgi:hypothetical protein
MGLNYLGRVRSVTMALAAVSGLVTATYASLPAALGLLAGAAWSLINLLLIQTLVVSATTPGIAQAIGVHNRAIPEILATPKVAGTAIGADEHGKPVIKIYTKEFVPPGHLKEQYDGFRWCRK